MQYQKEQMSPESEKGQQIAKEFWGMIMEFTDGDMSMLPQLMDVGTVEDPNRSMAEKTNGCKCIYGACFRDLF